MGPTLTTLPRQAVRDRRWADPVPPRLGAGPRVGKFFPGHACPAPDDAKAIPVVSSLSLSLSWITNFIVAVSFLPLRDLLSNGDEGEGRVFYVFGAILAAAALGIGRAYRG